MSAEAMEIVRTKDSGTLQFDTYLNDDESECMVIERYRDSAAFIEVSPIVCPDRSEIRSRPRKKGVEMGVTNRGLDSPDETRTFDHGQLQVVKIGESTVGRYTFEPGWRWSESVKPIAKTDSCQVHHVGYILSGRLHVKTDDGGEAEIGPGEAYEVHPGHDGWVVGDEAVTSVEFMGAERYATKG